MDSLHVSVRGAGASFVLGGLLLATFAPWHPDILARPVAEVVHDFGPWALIHVATVVSVVLALFGATGLVAAHAGGLGRLGEIGLLVETVGVIMTASLSMTEALVFPVAAERAPGMLSAGGPVLGSSLFVVAGALALGWPLGLSLLGLAAARAGTFARSAGASLAVSGPLFLLLAGPFVPVAGAVATVLFGGIQVWWGLLLWRSRVPPLAGPS